MKTKSRAGRKPVADKKISVCVGIEASIIIGAKNMPYDKSNSVHQDLMAKMQDRIYKLIKAGKK